MPANRSSVPRQKRIDEILDVATERFLANGYSGTTVAETADAGGMQTGTIFWYFPSKDDLLAAVFGRALERGMAALPTDLAPEDRLLTYLTNLRPFRFLYTAMLDRAPYSRAVRAKQLEATDSIRQLIRAVLVERHLWCDAETATEIVLAAFQGTNTQLEPRLGGIEAVRFLLDEVFRAKHTDVGAGRSAIA